LWATHTAYLNDASEFRIFQERLPEILKPAIKAGITELVGKSDANKVLIAQHGGIDEFVTKATPQTSAGMYEALLDFAEPFIASFCTAEPGPIAQHGLLSQWRGYGREGGYAIVFDTEKLGRLVEAEGQKWGYDLFGGDVVYSDDSADKIRLEFEAQFSDLASAMMEFLIAGGKSGPLEKTYPALIQCACRYKHWGFREEHEVRIIEIPPNDEIFAEQQRRGLATERKPRHHFMRDATLVPCIHLFEGITHYPDRLLPIKRIIVGPHRDKDERRRTTESLLQECQLSIPVMVSEIPYIGN